MGLLGETTALPLGPSGVSAADSPGKLTRYTVPSDANAAALLRDPAGGVVARWRGMGRGRVALWPITDSYALVLAGHGDRYGELWAQAFATLARARLGAPPSIDALPRAVRRVMLCGLGDRAVVADPGGRMTALLPDPALGMPPCAAYWPEAAGWHILRQTIGKEAQTWPFYVFAEDALPGVRATQAAEATLQLAGGMPAPAAATQRSRVPGSSWPWFLGWLAVSAALWWLERSRRGRVSP